MITLILPFLNKNWKWPLPWQRKKKKRGFKKRSAYTPPPLPPWSEISAERDFSNFGPPPPPPPSPYWGKSWIRHLQLKRCNVMSCFKHDEITYIHLTITMRIHTASLIISVWIEIKKVLFWITQKMQLYHIIIFGNIIITFLLLLWMMAIFTPLDYSLI